MSAPLHTILSETLGVKQGVLLEKRVFYVYTVTYNTV